MTAVPVVPRSGWATTMSTSDTEKVNIRIRYNGGYWRAHTVSRGFLARLRSYLAARPYLDTEIEER